MYYQIESVRLTNSSGFVRRFCESLFVALYEVFAREERSDAVFLHS